MHARALSPHGPNTPPPSSPTTRTKRTLGLSRVGISASGVPRSPLAGNIHSSVLSPGPRISAASRYQCNCVQRLSRSSVWLLFRQPRYLLLLLVSYVSLSGLYTGFLADVPLHEGKQISIRKSGLRFTGSQQQHNNILGSTYESPLIYKQFAADMQSTYNASFAGIGSWKHPVPGEGWRSCIDRPAGYPGPSLKTNGYIVVVVNGGLNQQRSSICNAVAVARLLNATLVIPHFHFNPIWRDPSPFREIFDEDHFISYLARDVRIVKELPADVLEGLGDTVGGYKVKVPAWATASFYVEKVLPQLLEARVIRFSPFANRLSYDGIPLEIQRLRCRTNFEALRFAPAITATAQKLTRLMRAGHGQTQHHPRGTDAGEPYVAVHLRFEKDMVAFSNCVYDGGEAEMQDMAKFREFGWRGKFTRPGRKISNPGDIRRNGKCPLTPLEVGMMLRGMGFHSSTHLFVAAGDIYLGEQMMAPLKEMFPHLQTKHTLLDSEELASFRNFSSRMAALDYTLCLHSEVFVITQGGNFPQILVGHRRFLNRGHWKTIRPDKRHLAVLFNNRTLRWQDFRTDMEKMRANNDKSGANKRKLGASIYTFPQPECMCPELSPPGTVPTVIQPESKSRGQKLLRSEQASEQGEDGMRDEELT